MLVGIDLGTTNSAVAVWRDGKAELIPNALGDLLTPSAVSLSDDGSMIVGRAARERQTTHADRTATLFKRLMGTAETLRLGKQNYTPPELSAMVLRQLKADAEAYLGETVTGAIITVPAYFNDKQRKATRDAGELAGLTVERLINEPTAAALAYGIHELDEERPFLVFDLGGGTFDVSLVEMFDGIIEVRASAGDNRLGGEDFNEAVVIAVKDKIEGWETLGKANPEKFRAVARAAAEKTRRALSEHDNSSYRFVWNDTEYDVPITVSQFDEAAAPLIDRLRQPVMRALRDGNVKAARLSEIVMVGGATRMPLIRRTATRMFGRFPNTKTHPDHAIALGAAVQAGLKSRDAALNEVRLTDVCPFTLGVEIAHREDNGRIINGIFSPIIERNTVIPASRSEYYQAMEKGQRQVTMNVYQGESRTIDRNVKLGEVTVPLPANTDKHSSIECRFTYDVSGLLEVDVIVPETGVARQLVIHDKETGMTPKELEKRRKELAKLKVHPRDEARNAATLARANGLFEDHLGQMREYIGRLIDHFRLVLDRQDPREIETERLEIERKLDEVAGENFL